MCGSDSLRDDNGTPVDVETIGAATKHRYFAAVADNIAAILFSFGIASQLEFLGELQQGLAAYVLYLAYYLLFESVAATTPAKFFFGLRIVRQRDGRRIGFFPALIRTVFRIVEVNPLVGFLPAAILIFFTRRKQRLGDLVAGTVVIHR
jgi:uncharacterized RDD family membrane protein YckC